MIYSDPWKRISAAMIDIIIFGLIISPILYFQQLSKVAYVTCEFAILLCSSFYYIYLHNKSGQTLGKKAVKIKVTKTSGENICLNTSIIRHLPIIIIGLFYFLKTIILVYNINIPIENFDHFSDKLTNNSIEAVSWIEYLFFILIVLDLMTILLNQKRRSLHDFIAKTVVINLDKQ